METNCWKLIDRTKITQNGKKGGKMCDVGWRGRGLECGVARRGNMDGKMTLLRACIGNAIERKRSVCLRFYANRLEHEIVRCGPCSMIEWGNGSVAVEVRLGSESVCTHRYASYFDWYLQSWLALFLDGDTWCAEASKKSTHTRSLARSPMYLKWLSHGDCNSNPPYNHRASTRHKWGEREEMITDLVSYGGKHTNTQRWCVCIAAVVVWERAQKHTSSGTK